MDLLSSESSYPDFISHSKLITSNFSKLKLLWSKSRFKTKTLSFWNQSFIFCLLFDIYKDSDGGVCVSQGVGVPPHSGGSALSKPKSNHQPIRNFLTDPYPTKNRDLENLYLFRGKRPKRLFGFLSGWNGNVLCHCLFAIKFQTFEASKNAIKTALKAERKNPKFFIPMVFGLVGNGWVSTCQPVLTLLQFWQNKHLTLAPRPRQGL